MTAKLLIREKAARRNAPLADRLRRKLVQDGAGCLNWTGYRSRDGYGRIASAGRLLQAHRVSYELTRGPISPGLVLDHLCRNPSCCNPDHLEPVTHRENILRAPAIIARRNKTACPQGHPFTEENTYLSRRPFGTRKRCKICARERYARANQ